MGLPALPSPLIWINAGETSGDVHGALLIRDILRQSPQARITGMAGPAMRAAGAVAVARTEELSVMGFTEVLARIGSITLLLRRLKANLAAARPDVVVLIDAPAFNFRVARMANELSIPVVYYISPKLWAWRQGRAKFIKEHVDRMVCIFPFEKEFYARFEVQADYVGHPLLSELTRPELDAIRPDPKRIGVLPGSRRGEVTALTPVFGQTAEALYDRDDELRFAAVAAPGVAEKTLRGLWPRHVPLEVLDARDRYAHMRECGFLLAASGTVSMESALLGVPTIVAYRLSPLTFFLAKRFVKVKYVSLPNIILDQPVFPEYLQNQATPANLAAQARDWLDHPSRLEDIRRTLAPLRDILGPPGAAGRAAEIVLETAGRGFNTAR
ncbi:MAG: lipid-A-disaccharide synthase [Thermodesulfobacteriota bacterium]